MASLHGASLLIALQIASRLLTFVANQLLLRYTTADLLGLATQLEVFYLSVLFFARESLRVAVQRSPAPAPSCPPPSPSAPDKPAPDRSGAAAAAAAHQAVVNTGHVALGTGLLTTAVLGRAYYATTTSPDHRAALALYAAAAVLELLAEPAWVLAAWRGAVHVRARAEGAASLAKCAVTLLAATTAATSQTVGAVPFALGQVAYAGVLLGMFTRYGVRTARGGGFSLRPRRLAAGRGSPLQLQQYLPARTLRLAASLMAQSVVKHLLTQGDTLLVAVLASRAAQGEYALAANYGGLVARLVLQPVEESCRAYFSRELAAPRTAGDKQARARVVLVSILRTYLIASLLIASLGPLATHPFLAAAAGPRWLETHAPAALAAYCFYIPLLALNGVAEAFVASVASEAQLHKQSAWMGVFSAVFGVAGYLCLRVWALGAPGLVWAGVVNMACRIVWSAWFIRRYFARDTVEVGALLPHPVAVAVGLVAPAVVRALVPPQSEYPGRFGAVAVLAKTAVAAAPVVFVVLFLERRFLLGLYRENMAGRRAVKAE